MSTLELLYFEGCPNHERLLSRLSALLGQVGHGADIRLRRVESEQAARRLRFLGAEFHASWSGQAAALATEAPAADVFAAISAGAEAIAGR